MKIHLSACLAYLLFALLLSSLAFAGPQAPFALQRFDMGKTSVEDLPVLHADDLARLAGYKQLVLEQNVLGLLVLPRGGTPTGPFGDYVPGDSSMLCVYGPRMRCAFPFRAVLSTDRPAADNALVTAAGEKACLVSYVPEGLTGGAYLPRQLVFVKAAEALHVDRLVQSDNPTLARLLDLLPLARSALGRLELKGASYVVFDACLLTGAKVGKGHAWLPFRRYLGSSLPPAGYEAAKFLGDEWLEEPDLGRVHVVKFNFATYWERDFKLGGHTFHALGHSKSELQRLLALVPRLERLRAEEVDNTGYYDCTFWQHNSEYLPRLAEGATTLGELIQRLDDFYYKAKRYTALPDWMPLDLLLTRRRYDCDSSAKVVQNLLRYRGFAVQKTGYAGHGWSELELPNFNAVLAIDMTAGNSYLMPATWDTLNYWMQKHCVETHSTSQDQERAPDDYSRPDTCYYWAKHTPRDWLLAGPFDCPTPAAIDVPCGPESNLALDAVYNGLQGANVGWTRPYADSKPGLVDLWDVFPAAEHCAVYALGYFYSPKARKALVRLNPNGAFKLWLNGKVAGEQGKDYSGSWLVTNVRWLPVKLREGWNTVLLKTARTNGDYAWFFTFCDLARRPLQDVRFTSNPADAGRTAPITLELQPEASGDLSLHVESDTALLKSVRYHLYGRRDHGLLAVGEFARDTTTLCWSARLPVKFLGRAPKLLEVVYRTSNDKTGLVTRYVQARRPVGIAPNGNGYYRAFLACGPFPQAKQGFFQLEPVEIAKLKPKPGDTLKGKTWHVIGLRPFAWSLSERVDYLPLERFLAEASNCFAYLVLYLDSPEERTARLSLGSDDGVKAWLNGRLVLAHNASRGAAPDQDCATVYLKQGANVLVLKIVNGGGPWGAYVRFLDAKTGAPLTDMPATFVP